MGKFVHAIGRNFNLVYDKGAIFATVAYLAKHNPIPDVTYDNIYDHMMDGAKLNAKWADEDRNDDGKWLVNFTGTAGYMILFSLIDYTAKNDFPVIQADVYVTPQFNNIKFVEEKVRG